MSECYISKLFCLPGWKTQVFKATKNFMNYPLRERRNKSFCWLYFLWKRQNCKLYHYTGKYRSSKALDPVLLRENTDQKNVAFSHILRSDPFLFVDQMKTYDLTWHILTNDSLKACEIHGINSNLVINCNLGVVNYGRMLFCQFPWKFRNIKEEKDVTRSLIQLRSSR